MSTRAHSAMQRLSAAVTNAIRDLFVGPRDGKHAALATFRAEGLEQRILFGGPGIGGYQTDETPVPAVPSYSDSPNDGPQSPSSPDNNGQNNNGNNGYNCCCCGGNNTVVDPSSSGLGDGAALGDPVGQFAGQPLISVSDLTANIFGINWGVDRSWTGLNNSGPVGNGWSISELPYLAVAGNTGSTGTWLDPGYYPGDTEEPYTVNAGYNDARISLVEGNSTFTFAIAPPSSTDPNEYNNYAAYGASGLTLQRVQVDGSYVMQLTDSAGDVTLFDDLYRTPDPQTNYPRPTSFPRGLAGESFGQFLSYKSANGTSVTPTYNSQGQLTEELVTNPSDPGASVEFDYNYSTVTNDLQDSGSDAPSNVSVKANGNGTITYGYRVSAVGLAGESLASPDADVTVLNGAIPGGHSNVITWTGVGSALYYRVYGGPEGSEHFLGSVNSGGPTYSFTDNGTETGEDPTTPPSAPSLVSRVVESINGQAVQQVVYGYYTGRLANGSGGYYDDPNGRLGDLESVTSERILSGGSLVVTGQDLYRYYKLTGESNGVSGQVPMSSSGTTNDELTTGGPDALQPALGDNGLPHSVNESTFNFNSNSNNPGADGSVTL